MTEIPESVVVRAAKGIMIVSGWAKEGVELYVPGSCPRYEACARAALVAAGYAEMRAALEMFVDVFPKLWVSDDFVMMDEPDDCTYDPPIPEEANWTNLAELARAALADPPEKGT